MLQKNLLDLQYAIFVHANATCLFFQSTVINIKTVPAKLFPFIFILHSYQLHGNRILEFV